MKLLDELKQMPVNILIIRRLVINIRRLKQKRPRIPVYSYRRLLRDIKKRGDVCHVIATGYSAVSAYKNNVIKEGDFIIGMNDAAFLPYTFDFYFCEDASRVDDKYKELTIKRMPLLEKAQNRISKLVFKNIYSSDPDFFSGISANIEYSVVLDTQLIYSPDVVKKVFEKPSVLVPQFTSTVITATMLAYHIGFKNIIIHGLDFSGPHVYHDETLQKQIGLEALTPYVPKNTAHGTASGQELVWPGLMKAFTEKDVNIFCASNESTFKKYAMVWDERYRYNGDANLKYKLSPPPPVIILLPAVARCGACKSRIAA
jgi:hypothetical protein